MNLVLRFYEQNQKSRKNSQIAVTTDGSSTEATIAFENYRYEKAASYDKIF